MNHMKKGFKHLRNAARTIKEMKAVKDVKRAIVKNTIGRMEDFFVRHIMPYVAIILGDGSELSVKDELIFKAKHGTYVAELWSNGYWFIEGGSYSVSNEDVLNSL